jgi:hypothetical protein
MARTTLLLALLLVVAGPPALAQRVCRANVLGGVTCPAPRPEPRPVLEAQTQALDRVRRRATREAEEDVFIPSWRVDRLGSTPLRPGERGLGVGCRSDSFGNLRC